MELKDLVETGSLKRASNGQIKSETNIQLHETQRARVSLSAGRRNVPHRYSVVESLWLFYSTAVYKFYFIA